MSMDPFKNINFQEDTLQAEKPLNIREVLHKYFYHWPVFLLAILLSFSIAFLYLRYATKIYHVQATILIKDDKAESANPLKSMGFSTDSRALENEMEILQSKSLMKDVVQELDVNIIYKTKGVAVMTDIYERTPVRLVFDDENSIGQADWKLEILDAENFILEDEQSESVVEGRFGAKVNTRFGPCRIEKTANLSPYISATIYIFLQAPEARANTVLANMTLNQINRQTSVLNIGLNDEVSQRGKDILNELIKVYSVASIEDKNRSIERSIQFIKDRLQYLSDELRAVEAKADNFRSANNITNVSGQGEALQAALKENDTRLNAVNLQLAAISDISKYINSAAGGESPPFVSGLNDASLQAQAKRFADLLNRRKLLLRTVPETNILVENLDQEIRDTKGNINTSLAGMRTFLNKEKNTLLSDNAAAEASISTLPLQERQLMNIERERAIKENLYVMLLQKLEEAELTSATTLADNRILEQAYGSTVPIKPEKGNVYLLAFVLGIFAPVAYVFAKDALNFRVINARDISDHTSVPILGEVMYQEDAESIVLDNHSRNAIAEQFRSIRTNLQYIFGRNKGARVTLFTSSMSGEGKSFVSSNVAAALAMAGRKTVVLELDLRKPKIAKYLKLKNKTGLSNYFIGQAAKENIVQESGVHPNLFVITSGPIPPNPAELLEQEGMDELISWLKTRFDEILIDTPPIGLVTDALILARLADASIYVVRHGVTMKSQIDAIELLRREKKFPKLNIIHNGIQLSGRYGYGYESTYAYGYGNGYGYYDEPKTKRKSGFRMPVLIRDILNRF